MKKIVVVILVFSLALFSFSCKKGSSHPIVGKWKIISAKGIAASSNIGTVYNFDSDGTVEIKKGFLKSEGKYSINGNNVEIKYKGRSNITLKATFKISGDEMVYKMKGSNQVFNMERQ